jgi:hypothetical protein
MPAGSTVRLSVKRPLEDASSPRRAAPARDASAAARLRGDAAEAAAVEMDLDQASLTEAQAVAWARARRERPSATELFHFAAGDVPGESAAARDARAALLAQDDPSVLAEILASLGSSRIVALMGKIRRNGRGGRPAKVVDDDDETSKTLRNKRMSAWRSIESALDHPAALGLLPDGYDTANSYVAAVKTSFAAVAGPAGAAKRAAQPAGAALAAFSMLAVAEGGAATDDTVAVEARARALAAADDLRVAAKLFARQHEEWYRRFTIAAGNTKAATQARKALEAGPRARVKDVRRADPASLGEADTLTEARWRALRWWTRALVDARFRSSLPARFHALGAGAGAAYAAEVEQAVACSGAASSTARRLAEGARHSLLRMEAFLATVIRLTAEGWSYDDAIAVRFTRDERSSACIGDIGKTGGPARTAALEMGRTEDCIDVKLALSVVRKMIADVCFLDGDA